MKIKRLLALAVLAGTTCSLGACKTEGEKERELDVELKEVPVNSLYEGIVALYQTKNYTLEVIHTYGAYREEIPDMIFTKNYIGYDGPMYEDLSVYYNDGDGVYHVSYTDDFLAGEYLKDKKGTKYTNLWDQSVVYTMYNTCAQYIKKTIKPETNEITIEDKDYKVAFLNTIVGNTDDYSGITLKAKYDNGKVVFDLAIDNDGKSLNSYKVTMKKVGTTKSDHLKMFVKNDGKTFEPNHDLSEMRRLLNLDNYVHRTYLINEGVGYWTGYEFFTEHYFFQTGTDATVGNAYMEFNYKDDPTLDNDFDMWGIYMVNVFRKEDGTYDAALVNRNPYNSSTVEVEECVRYPSLKLNLLNNLEYVKEGAIRDAKYEDSKGFFTGESKKYYFIEEKLVKNFVNNFSLDTAFEGVIFNTVGIEIELGAKDEDSVVCFHAIGDYPTDGMTYDVVLPLYSFGKANRLPLDTLYEMYNKKAN